ncbi:MAG: Periplasmic thiol:disulfide interchange protein DsbA [Candidatus Magasanikbacteria bacterium GW2011_GWA2_46_17]|uniref:Periplasmic thiol:disulfide interchange protein DsbA n=1 Tax=Candidatus Magasanikbacteria bacterium GW2011_GWA2_46_17 TaxID=1619042 RepID=A0A0G1RBB5_9BACT|nr:MAG: Periplasmic thiol:disulfide interchange protein DsbA [Candidatus Magasanikbacteria bacterium GW2011_GWA2_46_17]
MSQFYGGFTHVVGDNRAQARTVNRRELEAVDAHFLGNASAPITIVQFLDFKCPNSKAAAPIIRRLAQKYGSKAKIVIRHFPAESIHPGATQLSELAHCAYLEGDFWGMYDLLFQEQDNLSARLNPEDIGRLAAQVGLDGEKVKACMRAGRAKVAVNRDYADGYKFGVVGTPTFFVNGDRVQGIVPWEVWEGFLK